VVDAAVGKDFAVEVVDCASQIGSGALPLEGIPSAGLSIRPVKAKSGGSLNALSIALRQLPVPVVGHLADGALVLDLRCLADETGFISNMGALRLGASDALA